MASPVAERRPCDRLMSGATLRIEPRAERGTAEYDEQVARIEEQSRSTASVAVIARQLNLDYKFVLGVVREIDAEEARRLKAAPDEEKGRQIRILNGLVEKIAEGMEEGRVVRDGKGNPVYELVTDPDGNQLKTPEGHAVVRPLRDPPKVGEAKAIMLALSSIREMLPGLNTPKTAVTLDLTERSLIPRDQQDAFLRDPEYRAHVLALEQRERELLQGVQGPGHVAGPVRGGGQPWQVEMRPAPLALERPDDAGGDRRDPQAGHVHAPEAREVGVPVEVVPGLVSRHLPRSEGDLGQL